MERLDPRTPVIVGAGQAVVRDGHAPDPVSLLAAAAGPAVPPALRRSVDSVAVVRILSRAYPDPGALLARALGCSPRETVYSQHGGHSPLQLLHDAALRIQSGQSDVVLLGGAESWRTRRRHKRTGTSPGWPRQPPGAPGRVLGDELEMTSPAESRLGFGLPVHAYPVFETAIRSRLARDVPAHGEAVAALWAGFSRVAAGNPYAALREFHSAEDILRVSPENRMIGDPYRKLMVANDDVDQAAAIVVCSVEAARRAKVPRDTWVFIHGLAQATDTPFVSHRLDLSRSPAIAAAGQDLFGATGLGPGDIKYVDLYSCFPSAVQIAAQELGLGLDRQLTVTGGLTFAGGPWNNYTTHALATMISLLRQDPDEFGLCTANGGLLTKQAMGIFSARPARSPLRPSPPRKAPARAAEPDYDGAARVEAYTIMRDREGAPSRAFLFCRTPRQTRVLAVTDHLGELADEGHEPDLCGRVVVVSGGQLLQEAPRRLGPLPAGGGTTT